MGGRQHAGSAVAGPTCERRGSESQEHEVDPVTFG